MQFSAVVLAIMAPLALAAPVPTSNNAVAAPIVKRSDGSTFIHNNCAFDMTVNPCAAGSSQGFTTIPAGKTWSQPQQNFGGAGQGVSLKINNAAGDPGNIAQFEYTVSDIMDLVFYDLSLINGNPFQNFPQNLTSMGAGSEVFCATGEQPCKAAYTWAEQVATQSAPQGSDLHYFVC